MRLRVCECVHVCLEIPAAPTRSCCLSWGGEAGKGVPDKDTSAGTGVIPLPHASD